MSTTVFASAARTAQHDSEAFESSSGRFSLLWDITSFPGTPPVLALQLLIEDPIDGTFKLFHTFGLTQSAVGQSAYHVGSGDSATNFFAPRMPRVRYKVRITPSTSAGATYSMSKLER